MQTITYTGRSPITSGFRCCFATCNRTATLRVSAIVRSNKNGLSFLSALFEVCKRHEASTERLLKEGRLEGKEGGCTTKMDIRQKKN